MARGRKTRFVGVGLGVLVALCGVAAEAAAQAPPVTAASVAGTWEGVSKGTNGEVPVKVELQAAAGKLTGTIGTPIMVLTILDGKLEGDVLTLTMDAEGMAGTMTGKVAGDRIEATWTVGSESGAVSLARAAAAGAATPGGDPLSGEWVGEAMVQGQPMPITLILKLAGDVVSGAMQSAMGQVPLTSGSWKDGTLVIAFPYAGGEPVTMGGKIQDGKLGGVFDYNSGEIQGTWWAARK